MVFLPLITNAEYQGGFRIRVSFNDRTAKTIDFYPWLEGPIFEPLKDPVYFRRFFVDGGTVSWPNGADIAPEAIYAAPTAAGGLKGVTRVGRSKLSPRTKARPAVKGKRAKRS